VPVHDRRQHENPDRRVPTTSHRALNSMTHMSSARPARTRAAAVACGRQFRPMNPPQERNTTRPPQHAAAKPKPACDAWATTSGFMKSRCHEPALTSIASTIEPRPEILCFTCAGCVKGCKKKNRGGVQTCDRGVSALQGSETRQARKHHICQSI